MSATELKQSSANAADEENAIVYVADGLDVFINSRATVTRDHDDYRLTMPDGHAALVSAAGFDAGSVHARIAAACEARMEVQPA